MPLVIEQQEIMFDLSQIKQGYLIYGKHYTWQEGKSGFVTSVAEKKLTVQYHPGIGNITNHFFIPVNEVAAGEWEIRWSADLTEIWESKPQEIEKNETGKEEARKNETGGTDL